MTLTRVCWIIFGHKKQEYFVFLTVKCKENGSGTNLMEDLACKVKIPSQTSGMTLTRVCWMICGHKKQQYFVFFTEKCKKKWSSDKSYGRFSMQSANTVSDEWKSSHLSVSDNLQNQNWPI